LAAVWLEEVGQYSAILRFFGHVLKYAEKGFSLLVFLTTRGQESYFERQEFND
jgi:hypothetical protein